MAGNRKFTVDSRELKEIQHCLYYAKYLAHGTVGHNLLMLSAKAFNALGFDVVGTGLAFQGVLVDVEKSAEITVEGNESS